MRIVLLLLLVAFLFWGNVHAQDRTPGFKCMACTLLVGTVEQMAIHTKRSIPDVAKQLCSDISEHWTAISFICQHYTNDYIPIIDRDYQAGKTPDQTCREGLGFCQNYTQCAAYPQWPPQNLHQSFQTRHLSSSLLHQLHHHRSLLSSSKPSHPSVNSFLSVEHHASFLHILSLLGIPIRIQSSSATASEHTQLKSSNFGVPTPKIDLDKDGHSTIQGFRGSAWVGKDCNDINSSIYPGRRITTYDANTDHNCNGIKGKDSQGRSYEDMYCANSGMRGVIGIGDSTVARFRMPPEYLNATFIADNANPYDGIVTLGENELDWPQCSWTTGHMDDPSQCPTTLLPFKSLYQRFKERNLCIHRDYQNYGVNGADSITTAPPNGYITALHPRVNDQPATVFFSLIGNDVCNYIQSFDVMTKPDAFKTHMLLSLQYIDDHMADDSYVVMFGLADGRFMYDTLKDELHPTGLTYTQFFDYMNCLVVTPCWGWMNSNKTILEGTAAHAQALSDQVKSIVDNQAEYGFKHIKLAYYDNNFKYMLDRYHGDPRDLIEPSDGFHPSQTGNAVYTELIYEFLEKNLPGAIPPVNPFNSNIAALFGNQGGY